MLIPALIPKTIHFGLLWTVIVDECLKCMIGDFLPKTVYLHANGPALMNMLGFARFSSSYNVIKEGHAHVSVFNTECDALHIYWRKVFVRTRKYFQLNRTMTGTYNGLLRTRSTIPTTRRTCKSFLWQRNDVPFGDVVVPFEECGDCAPTYFLVTYYHCTRDTKEESARRAA